MQKYKISIFLVVIVLIVVVMLSGCTSSTKTYNDNYISFNYPDKMNVTGGSHTDGESITGKTEDKRNGFIFEIWQVSDKTDSDYPSILETWKTKWINEGLDIGISTKKTGYTTIDGIKTVYTISSDNDYDYYLVKGNMGYRLSFNGRTMSDGEIQDILKSIKIK